MRAHRLLAAVVRPLIVGAALVVTIQPAGAESLAGLAVEVTPTTSSIDLGEMVEVSVSVTNTSTEPAEAIIAHIDITDTDRSGSVDPEDWTATLSEPIDSLGPGETATATWKVQPISPGTFTLYAVALAPGASDVASSNTLTVEVADRRSLNPQGILPVSIATPVLVGGLLANQYRRNRRRD